MSDSNIDVDNLMGKRVRVINPTLPTEENHKPVTFPAPVKSDGGSSKYYELVISTKEGEFKCEAKDIIRSVFGNDFSYGNVFKALVRMYQAQQGCGKEGVSVEYDANKIKYFVDEIKDKK